MWARDNYDPIKAFEEMHVFSDKLTHSDLQAVKREVKTIVDNAVKYADNSPQPPADLAKELEFPTDIDTDYNQLVRPSFAEKVNRRVISTEKHDAINAHMDFLREKAVNGDITIAEAVNLAIHEEMLRDPTTTSTCITFIFLFLDFHLSRSYSISCISPSRRFASRLVIWDATIDAANIWIIEGKR
jgi:2-oxoisovalerate dehydrogenase E1 component